MQENRRVMEKNRTNLGAVNLAWRIPRGRKGEKNR